MPNQFTFVRDILDLGGDSFWGFVAAIAVWAAPITGFVSLIGLVAVWLERKISAHIQCRLGPMEVGPHGLLQTLADGIKLLGKEDLVPDKADRVLFALAPMIVFAATYVSFAVLPFSQDGVIVDLNIGIFFIAAVGSLEAIGVVMAGWSSNNKWSLFGAIRAATQVVSYEVPLGLTLLAGVVCAGTMSLNEMTMAQEGWIWSWFIFRNPFMWAVFLIYFTASLAECQRAPFDLPEAESELVSGFHTEYSGMRFAVFFLAEYGKMYVVSALGVVMFFGGWYSGIPMLDNIGGLPGNLIGAGIMVTKSMILVCVQMWIRWTLPRIRLDQVMDICLKYLLPLALGLLMLVALWQGILPGEKRFGIVMIVAMIFAFLKMRKMVRNVMSKSSQQTELPVFKV